MMKKDAVPAQPAAIDPLEYIRGLLASDPYDWQREVSIVAMKLRLVTGMGDNDILKPPTFAAAENAANNPLLFQGGYAIYDGMKPGTKDVIVQNPAKAFRLSRGEFVNDFWKNGPKGTLASLVPNFIIDIPAKDQTQARAVLAGELSHGIADSVMLFSGFGDLAKAAFQGARVNQWCKMAMINPLAILGGFWNSRAGGCQTKWSRAITTWIDATEVTPVKVGGQYVPCIQGDLAAEHYKINPEEPEGTKDRKEAMSSLGITFHPITPAPIGVHYKACTYYSKLNIATLRELGTVDPAMRPKVQLYLACLGCLILSRPQLDGLRGNMNLVRDPEHPIEFTVVYKDGTKQDFPLTTRQLVEATRVAAADLGISPEPVRMPFLPDKALAVIEEEIAAKKKGKKTPKPAENGEAAAAEAPKPGKPAAVKKAQPKK